MEIEEARIRGALPGYSEEAYDHLHIAIQHICQAVLEMGGKNPGVVRHMPSFMTNVLFVIDRYAKYPFNYGLQLSED